MNDLRTASITATLLGKIWEQEKVMEPIEPIQPFELQDNTLELMSCEFAKAIASMQDSPHDHKWLGRVAAEAAIEALKIIEQYRESKQ